MTTNAFRDSMALPKRPSHAFEPILVAAASELFDSLGAYPREGTPTFLHPLGVSIALASTSMRGIVVIAGERDALTATLPPNVEGAILEDWVKELANQLAGRLVRKLSEYGYPAAVGLPRLGGSPTEGDLGPRTGSEIRFQCARWFEGRRGRFAVRFEGLELAGLDLRETRRVHAANESEGGLIIF